jgi:nucleobase:cation symporter-1, NCS1 family
VAVTSATLVIYGQAGRDPVQLLSRFGSPVLHVMGLVGLGLAMLATNLAARPTTSPTSGSAVSPSVSGR